MTKIYTTRFEEIRAFSTARKAIESIAGQGWSAYMGSKMNAQGHIVESIMLVVDDASVSKLISKLNKDGFLSLESGRDQMSIDRLFLE